MKTPPQSLLESLEERIQSSLSSLDVSGLDILGYGEITTVFRLETPVGTFACKRFPVFRQAAAAENHQNLVLEYVDDLTRHGLRILETEFMKVPLDEGRVVLFLVQPILDPSKIGPELFRSLSEGEASSHVHEILEALKGVVSDRLAPDGQLSNWVFGEDGLMYLDISTPFMRDESGHERCDWETLSQSVICGLLRPLRPYYFRKIPETVAFYYSLRGQALDFLGNLRKEKLDHLIEPFLPVFNDRLELADPITFDDVKTYYNENADFYALLMRLFRINRWYHRKIMRATYPNFIPPPIERNKF